jgi:hypothetical protein
VHNVHPSVLSALPHVRPIADYEAAFNARRRELGAVVTVVTHVRRASLFQRLAAALFAPSSAPSLALAQPSMAWVDGPRTQPRDGRGRFLSRAWLAEAEVFLPRDAAWFRSPVAE